MNKWVNLTTCSGDGVQNPSGEQLRASLKELFQSNDEEHPDAWIECGSENGPLYSLSIYSSGYALYTKYSDADMSDELESSKIVNVSEDTAFYLCKDVINGKFA